MKSRGKVDEMQEDCCPRSVCTSVSSATLGTVCVQSPGSHTVPWTVYAPGGCSEILVQKLNECSMQISHR